MYVALRMKLPFLMSLIWNVPDEFVAEPATILVVSEVISMTLQLGRDSPLSLSMIRPLTPYSDEDVWENAKEVNVRNKNVVQKCLISCIILFCYFKRSRVYDVNFSLRFKSKCFRFFVFVDFANILTFVVHE